MKTLISQLQSLQQDTINNKIGSRLQHFASFKNKSSKEWFSELCFCILTANSKLKTALEIEKQLKHNGYINLPQDKIAEIIRRSSHRFHNTKAKFIVEAREHIDVKEKLDGMNDNQARDWLVKNINGLGMKESSHFLRNVGYKNLAIVDRHIINLLTEQGIIKKPAVITKKHYLDIESKLKILAEKAKMSLAELDLYLWYMKTGVVEK